MDIQKDIAHKKLLELAEENNKLLKKMHRAQVTSRTLRILYWLIIIGIAVGGYYYLQPYLDQVLDIYGNIQNATDQVDGLFSGVENPSE